MIATDDTNHWHFACQCRLNLSPCDRRAYRAVVDHLRAAGPASAAELGSRLGLGQDRVGELVDWAIADGLAVEGAGRFIYVRP